MKKVLTLNTGLNGTSGKSNKLVQDFVSRLKIQEQVSVTERDLAVDDIDHLNLKEMQSWMTPENARSNEQAKLVLISDTLIAELENSDVIVIGMPMYNFGAPSVFKSWIDRVARAGKTFRYTENGPVGLLNNKKVYVLATRGGLYAGTPKDTQTQYIKDVFAFIGIEDVEFVYAEGLAMGEESAKNALEQAEQKIVELIENLAA